jgi:hypothetical protein
MMKRCPRCQRAEQLEAGYCGGCGHQFRTQFGSSPEPTQVFPYAGPLRDRGELPMVRPYDQKALAAGVGGFLSWFVLPPVFSVMAILWGFWALGCIQRTGHRGKPAAIAGILFGLVGLAWWCATMAAGA